MLSSTSVEAGGGAGSRPTAKGLELPEELGGVAMAEVAEGGREEDRLDRYHVRE